MSSDIDSKNGFSSPDELVEVDDPLKTLRSQRVQQISLAVAIAELLVIPIYWSAGSWGAVIPLSCGVFMMGVCMFLARTGFVEAASITLIVSVTVMSAALQWLDQGLRDAAVLAFPVVLVLGGILLGVRAFVALLISMIAFLIFMTMATEVWGWRTNPPGYLPFNQLRDLSIILAVGGWSVWFVVNDLRKTLVRLNENIRKYQEARKDLSHVSHHDQLTGLPNIHLERLQIDQSLAQARKTSGRLALLFINLDSFKSVNDALGHYSGDELLKQVAARLTAVAADLALVSRHGGDEFVMCLPGIADVAEVSRATEAVLAAVRPPYTIQGKQVLMTCSIGLAVFPQDGDDYEILLRHANIAMSIAKTSGRNSCRYFDQAMHTAIVERAALEDDLRNAILGQHLVLHYQPLINTEGRVVGAEALVRWIHPKRGVIGPSGFIAAAEESGLILPLGSWVLEQACRQLVQWSANPVLEPLLVSVNVSAAQLKRDDFVSTVAGLLEQTGVNPARLKLEITESLLIFNLDETIQKMSVLKALGLSFSLDDFGTGYSSLSYLSRLPIDQLKIDRSFVSGIESRDDAVAICAATISLAHSLKLSVVAEGVETEAQRYFLSTVHRCDLLQGFLFSPPRTVADFEAFVLD